MSLFLVLWTTPPIGALLCKQPMAANGCQPMADRSIQDAVCRREHDIHHGGVDSLRGALSQTFLTYLEK